jgi:tRNA (guanine-N7-)-methyltransferase
MCDNLNVELKHTNIEPPICWEHIFGNTAPVEIEIGFGKCGFLLEIAPQYPTINFVGLESARKYYRKGITKIQRSGLKNIKLMWGEAVHIFKRYIPDDSVANVYINFPDPWPKRRHAKRRLLKAELVSLLARKLNSNGCIEIATDVESYKNQIQEIFLANSMYDMLYYQTSNHQGRVRTYCSDYELMFLKEGKTIHYVKYKKNDSRRDY